MVRPIWLRALTFLAVPSPTGGADSVRREFWKFGGREMTVAASTISVRMASERRPRIGEDGDSVTSIKEDIESNSSYSIWETWSMYKFCRQKG
jgi:hypothetical protein